jgi:hypothetical protein
MSRTWAIAFLLFGCGATSDEMASPQDHSSSGNEGVGGAMAGATTAAGASGKGGNGQGAGGTQGAGGSHATGGSHDAGESQAAGGTNGMGGSQAADAAGAGGGSSGLSGSLGTGGATVTPRTCSDLPKAGVWEKISPTEAQMESDGVVIDPFDPSIVWAGFANHGIYKSTNCGATFTHVSTGKNGALVDAGAPISMVVDPHNPGTIYSTSFGGNSGLWKSTNGGVDFQSLITQDGNVGKVVPFNMTNSVAMNPHDSKQLIVTMHDSCKPPYGELCVAESKDAGETWEVKTLSIPGATGWASGAGAWILDAKTWLFTSATYNVWLTTDDGATWKKVSSATTTGGKTLIGPFYPSNKTGHYYLSALEGMIESDDGMSWKLIPNSGRSVGFAMGDGRLYSADLWTTTYRVANESDLTKWTVLPPPAGLAADTGSPYLAYDAVQHILYSSNWFGGLWRLATP